MRLTKIAIPVFCATMTIACAPDSLHAQGILVDDFATDIPETSVSPVQSYADGGVLGGHVRMWGTYGDNFIYSVTGGVLRVRNNDAASRQFFVTYDGASGIVPLWELPNVDLTSGGKNSQMKLKVRSVNGPSPNIWFRTIIYRDADNYSYHSRAASGAGILEYPLGSFDNDVGTGADYTAATSVELSFTLGAGDEVELDWFTSGDVDFPEPPELVADTEGPSLSFLKKKRLKTPRARHKIVGIASDNEAVTKVEVKSRLAKGWRKAKLRAASGRWIHRTPRLDSGRNKFKVRAWDESGNRSRVKRVKAMGL